MGTRKFETTSFNCIYRNLRLVHDKAQAGTIGRLTRANLTIAGKIAEVKKGEVPDERWNENLNTWSTRQTRQLRSTLQVIVVKHTPIQDDHKQD
jgi:hypothetical protein